MLSALDSFAILSQTPAGRWEGEFVLTITGSGKASGRAPNQGSWSVNRTARGTIVLDNSFAGAGIARTTDPKNETRYSSWIANSKQVAELKVHDRVWVYGPLFSPQEIRDDVTTYDCPIEGEGYAPGKVASAILQIDHQAGTFTLEAPRIYAKGNNRFVRKFVKGPPKWVATKPIDKTDTDVEFEIVSGLNQPETWYRMSGPYKEGQTEIDLSRKIDFHVNLGASIKAPSVSADLKLILKLKR